MTSSTLPSNMQPTLVLQALDPFGQSDASLVAHPKDPAGRSSLTYVEILLASLDQLIDDGDYDLARVFSKMSSLQQALKGRAGEAAYDLRKEFVRIIHAVYIKDKVPFETLRRECGISPAYCSFWFRRFELNARDCTEKTPHAGKPYRAYAVCPEALNDLSDPDVAYVLGFIWADGHVLHTEKGAPEGVRICLKPSDKSLLRDIRDVLGSDAPIYGGASSLRNGRTYAHVALAIYSRVIGETLETLGYAKRRGGKGNVPPPQVPADVEHHFWRGVCDGDGHIKRDKRCKFHLSGWEVAICGSEALTMAFYDFVNRKLGIDVPVIKNGASQVNYRAHVSGVRAIILAETLYPEGAIALPRKYEIARALTKARSAGLKAGMRERKQGQRLVYKTSASSRKVVQQIFAIDS